MKILVIRNAFDHDFGGAERLAVHVAKELELNGLRSIVVSRQPKLLDYAKKQGVPHHKGLWWSKQNWSGKNVALVPLYILWQFVLVVWYLQLFIRIRPDVIHAMSKDDFISATISARILGRPVIWTDPADLKHVLANHKVWYKNPVGKIIYAVGRLAKAITLVSHSEKRLIEQSLGGLCPSNYVVAHIAGKDETVEPISRTKEDQSAVIFCSTSRLVVAKGISELVQAFNQLSKDSDAYRLWLIGEGPDEESFKKEAGDNPCIVFKGHQEKPLTHVAASDVFVHPTHHEGFSLSLAEAAMLGKPMIATNVGGNPELVNDANGILFPVHDVDALCVAMKKLGGDEAMRVRLGKQARHDYVKNFDFSEIIKKTFIPLYENKNRK